LSPAFACVVTEKTAAAAAAAAAANKQKSKKDEMPGTGSCGLEQATSQPATKKKPAIASTAGAAAA